MVARSTGSTNKYGLPMGAGLTNEDKVMWLYGCIIAISPEVPMNNMYGHVLIASPSESG